MYWKCIEKKTDKKNQIEKIKLSKKKKINKNKSKVCAWLWKIKLQKKCWKDTSVMCMIGTGIKRRTCSIVTWLLKHLHCAFCSLTDSLVLACNYLFISTKSIQMLNTMFWAWIFVEIICICYIYISNKRKYGRYRPQVNDMSWRHSHLNSRFSPRFTPRWI